MVHQSLYKVKECPSCHSPRQDLDWMTWCSRCGVVVCSKCVQGVHDCKDGYHFGVPGRGTRYFSAITLHEDLEKEERV